MPHLAAVNTAAIAANDMAGKTACAAGILLSFPFLQFGLNEVKYLLRNNGRMAVCYIILWNLAFVGFPFFGQKINREALLRNNVGADTN